MSYRANASLDMHVLPHRDQGHGPRSLRNGGQDASVLIDATLKEDFPPISLPKREYMERARVIWEELGLPKLKPEAPWFGYSLGEWSADLDEAAARAVAGDYFETGALLEARRRSDLAMNTEVRRAEAAAITRAPEIVAIVGWAEPKAKPITLDANQPMGFAALDPPYEPRRLSSGGKDAARCLLRTMDKSLAEYSNRIRGPSYNRLRHYCEHRGG
jgi:hypothetical protein